MKQPRNLFEKLIMEAPGDPPELAEAPTSDSPPDLPDAPSDDILDGGGGPPDDLGGGELGEEDLGGFEDDGTGDPGGMTEEEEPLELDEKISAIMNQNLFQRYLALLNTVNKQISNIKKHNDVLYSLNNDSLEILGSLSKLDENIRLYIDNTFLNENYSKNLLFFNKCLNLLSMLKDIFEKNVSKGIKAVE